MPRVLVVLFVLVIALPLAGNLAGFDGGDAEAENRELATFPHWDGTVASAVEYPDRISRWFEDHFAFRATLVRWYGESRLCLLGVSPSTVVVKGDDGWLYYGDDGGVEDYANATLMTAGEVDAWHDALVRARDWLQHQHIAYVFTIAPDKHVIYPEHMPATIRKLHQTSRTDQVYATLSGTGVITVDLRPSLREAKMKERLYDLTDTHWNDRGVLVAYQHIIEAVRQQVPRTPPAWTRDDFEPVERQIAGKDLAGMLGLKRVLHETELSLVPRRTRRARVVDPPGAEPTAEVGRLVTEMPDATLPRAVIFRDSFASRLAPFLSEHFSRAVYLWQNDFDATVIAAEHPDIVIEEIAGRHLYGFIASPELVPK
jgi:alginate O-acetyltransferase complex protein AlgJ